MKIDEMNSNPFNIDLKIKGNPKIFNSFKIVCPCCQYIDRLDLDEDGHYYDITAGFFNCEICHTKLFFVCFYKKRNSYDLNSVYIPPKIFIWSNKDE